MTNEIEKIKHYLICWASSQKKEMRALFKEERRLLGRRRNKKDKDLETGMEDVLFSTLHEHLREGDFLLAMDLLRLNETEISSYAAMLDKHRTAVEVSKKTKTDFSKRGGIARIIRNPIQAAKRQEKNIIFEWWQDWQKNPEKYKSKAEFARDMLTNSDSLKSQKKIEDWCREWKKAHPAG